MKKHLIIFFILASLSSCQNKDYALEHISFTYDSFKSIELTNPDVISTEGMFLGKPVSVNYHPQDFLLISDPKNTKQLIVFDLRAKRFMLEVNRGRSDNELLHLKDVTISGNNLYLSSTSDKKILKMSYNENNRNFIFDKSFSFSNQFLRGIPYKDGFITLASASSEDRFHIWDKHLNVIDTLGTFPSQGINAEGSLHNGVLQSDIGVYSNYVICAYKGVDYIDIYKDLTLVRRLRGPELDDVSIKIKEYPNGMVATYLTPDKITYSKIVTNDDGFWVGYNGCVIEEKEIPTSDDLKIKKIFHFKWDGTPCESYILDNPISDFTIDHTTNTLYGLTDNPEPILISYKLL